MTKVSVGWSRSIKGGAIRYEFVSSGDVAVHEQEPDDLDDDEDELEGIGIRFFDDMDEDKEDDDDLEEPASDDEIVGVPAFALRWDRYKVDWRGGRILGQQNQNSDIVDFAEQQGVYILYDDSSEVYVGRTTTDNLYNRLREHDKHKSARWNKFSWFGFRGVDDQGKLNAIPTKVNPESLVSVLETVLIEVLNPQDNKRGGDYLGIRYGQVMDPYLAKIAQSALSRTDE